MKDLATYHDENRLIHETDRRLHAADMELRERAGPGCRGASRDERCPVAARHRAARFPARPDRSSAPPKRSIRICRPMDKHVASSGNRAIMRASTLDEKHKMLVP